VYTSPQKRKNAKRMEVRFCRFGNLAVNQIAKNISEVNKAVRFWGGSNSQVVWKEYINVPMTQYANVRMECKYRFNA